MAKANKNGNSTTATKAKAEPKEKKEPIKRVPFITTDLAKPILNDDGKLTGLPSDNGFDGKLHLKPSREDYASDATFFDFRAEEMTTAANAALERAEQYTKMAEDIRKYGDPEARKKVAKLDKMAASIADMHAELAAQGVEIDLADLLKDAMGDES